MKKSFVHIAIASSLLLGSVVAYVLWYAEVEKTRTAITTTALEVEAKTAEAKRIAQAKGALAALSENEARITEYFVSNDDIGTFLETIGRTGNHLGSKVTIVSVTEDALATPRTRVVLAVTVTGSFDAVMKTVGALEYGPYDVELRNLSVDAARQETGPTVWTAVATYSYGAQTP